MCVVKWVSSWRTYKLVWVNMSKATIYFCINNTVLPFPSYKDINYLWLTPCWTHIHPQFVFLISKPGVWCYKVRFFREVNQGCPIYYCFIMLGKSHKFPANLSTEVSYDHKKIVDWDGLNCPSQFVLKILNFSSELTLVGDLNDNHCHSRVSCEVNY